MKKYCNTCGLRDPMRHVCRLTGIKISPDIDFCSRHILSNDLPTCEICGNGHPNPIIDITDGKTLVVCPQCFNMLDTCQVCSHSRNCSFETDPSPIPKVVEKVIRQGYMTTVSQVLNPERIEITCKKGCPCYSEKNGCGRQTEFRKCDNYEQMF